MRSTASFVVVTFLLSGCTRWEAYRLLPEPAPALPPALRVWSTDGVRTDLWEPRVRGDTVYGRSHGDTIGVAVREIERAARPRVDAARTTGAVLGGMAGWIALGLAVGAGE
jgi:hypothetical protein